MQQRKKHIILLLFTFFSLALFAQTKLYVQASKEAYLGSSYAISFVLENGTTKTLKLPQEFPGLEFIGGPNQSSSRTNYNGKVSSKLTLTYFFQAIKEGTFTIPKASMEVDGVIYETEEISFSVKKANKKPQANAGNINQNHKQQNKATEAYDWKKEVADNLFLKMYADNEKPYTGEQLTIYLKLYQRISTTGIELAEMPSFDGFWKHEFKLVDDDNWGQEQVNGVMFRTKTIGKFALFPQRAGVFNVSPMKLRAGIQLRVSGGNSIIDQIFGRYENKIYNFESNSLKIVAKELPLEGKPANFSGAVGQFKYTAKIDSPNTETFKAINLKTSISGTGNIMMVEAPLLALDESFELFDPEEKEYISKRSSAINGTKKYDYAFIPNEPGNFTIAPLEFSYFDPKTKKYKTSATDSLKIYVKASDVYLAAQAAEIKANAESSKEAAVDFADIKKENNYPKESTGFKFNESTRFKILFASPAFLALLLFFIKKRKENYNPDLVALNKRKANKLALKKLKQAAVFLKAKDQKGFYNEVIRSLWDYVSLKLNIDPEHLSKDNINEKLLAQNVSEEIANEYTEVIKSCEMALYSSIETNQMKADFEKAKALIIKLEDVL